MSTSVHRDNVTAWAQESAMALEACLCGDQSPMPLHQLDDAALQQGRRPPPLGSSGTAGHGALVHRMTVMHQWSTDQSIHLKLGCCSSTVGEGESSFEQRVTCLSMGCGVQHVEGGEGSGLSAPVSRCCLAGCREDRCDDLSAEMETQ